MGSPAGTASCTNSIARASPCFPRRALISLHKPHAAAEVPLTFRCSHVNDAPKPRWSGWKHAACRPACSPTPARGLVAAAGVAAEQDSTALSSHLLLESASAPPVLVTGLRAEQFPRFLAVAMAEELPPLTAGRQQACGGLKLKQGGDVPISFPRFFKSEGRGVSAHLPGGGLHKDERWRGAGAAVLQRLPHPGALTPRHGGGHPECPGREIGHRLPL